jgi:sec-independent protein translocase protein TatA
VPNLGLSELIVILMILLLVFGASRLPQIGESLGRTVRGLKRGMASNDQIEVRSENPQPGAQPGPTSDAKSQISDAEIVETKKS